MDYQTCCPECNSTEQKVEKITVDKTSRAKIGILNIILGIGLGIIGLGAIFLSIATWGDPEVRGKSLYVLVVGILFAYWAIRFIIEYIRKEDLDFHTYTCSNCGRKWRIIDKNGDSSFIQSIINQSKDENLEVRRTAFTELMNLRDLRGEEILVKGLEDQDPDIRSSAIAGLSWNRNPELIESLVNALEDKDNIVRGTAASQLGRFNNPKTVAPLIKYYLNVDMSDHEEKAVAQDAINDTKNETMLEPWLEAYQSEDPNIRLLAVEAFAEMEDKKAKEALVSAMKDQDKVVSGTAERLLKRKRDNL